MSKLSSSAAALAACMACMVFAGTAHGQAGPTCAAGTISEITFDRMKPFATSPGSTFGWLFQGLNAIHVRTLPQAIRWEIFFEEGDCLSPELLAESERALRSLPHISEARVTSEELPDGSHHVTVQTLDAWALSAAIAFTVDNGFQLTGVSVNYKNVVGTGTQAAYFRNIYRERERTGPLVRQPNLFGTRVDVAAYGGYTRPGNFWTGSLFRPYAGEVGAHAFRAVGGEKDDYFLYSTEPASGYTQAYLRFEAEEYEVTYQHRSGRPRGPRFIAGLGVSRESIRFPFGDDGTRVVLDNEFDDPQPAPPEVRDALVAQANEHATERVNLTLGFRNLDFSNIVGLDALRASQDVLSGGDFTVTVAPSFHSEHGLRDVLLRLRGSLGLGGERAYVLFNTDLQTRHVGAIEQGRPKGWRDVMYEINGHGYWDVGEESQTFAWAQWAGGFEMDRPYQLTLGGREAVRGYNDDAYPGARRVLLTLEQRRNLPGLSTSFADLGLVAFADAGKMWGGDVPFGADTGWKAGVGAGLRVSIPAGGSNVLRVEVGTPLTGERDTKGTTFRIYAELLGILDRRSWPSQLQRSRWYSTDPDLTTRPVNPLAES